MGTKKHIKLPKNLTAKIDVVIEAGYYTTTSEFVKDAIRRLLQFYGVPLELNPLELDKK